MVVGRKREKLGTRSAERNLIVKCVRGLPVALVALCGPPDATTLTDCDRTDQMEHSLTAASPIGLRGGKVEQRQVRTEEIRQQERDRLGPRSK